jgi:hypothetical protein
MQIFLPEYSYAASAKVLDQKRLVKQLLEGRQMLAALAGETKGWRNHPATRMFEGYEHGLIAYSHAIAMEMAERGYKWENNWNEIVRLENTYFRDNPKFVPPWLRDDERHMKVVITHRGRLFEKDPIVYAQFEEESKIKSDYLCCDRCLTYWPSHEL